MEPLRRPPRSSRTAAPKSRRSGDCARVVAAEAGSAHGHAADGARGAGEDPHLPRAEWNSAAEPAALLVEFVHRAAAHGVINGPAVVGQRERRLGRPSCRTSDRLAGSCAALTANRYSTSPAAWRVAMMPGQVALEDRLDARLVELGPIAAASRRGCLRPT